MAKKQLFISAEEEKSRDTSTEESRDEENVSDGGGVADKKKSKADDSTGDEEDESSEEEEEESKNDVPAKKEVISSPDEESEESQSDSEKEEEENINNTKPTQSSSSSSESSDSESEEEEEEEAKKLEDNTNQPIKPIHSSSSESSDESESESEEEEEQQTKKEEEDTKQPTSPIQSSSSSESSEESESESEKEKPCNQEEIIKKPTNPIQSSSSSESDKAEPTKQEQNNISLPVLQKPNKPTHSSGFESESSSHTKKSRSSLKPSSKRPADSQYNETSHSLGKKKRKVSSRLWSDRNEIALLEGMISFKYQNEIDHITDFAAFYESIKDSIQPHATINQVTDKILRFKAKYDVNATKEKKGEQLLFSRNHESKIFELSNKYWDTTATKKSGISSSIKSAIRVRKVVPIAQSQAAVTVVEQKAEKNKDEAMTDEDEKDFDSVYTRLSDMYNSRELFMFNNQNARRIMKENIHLIGRSKAKELDRKWRNLLVEECEVNLKRTQLMAEQHQLVLEALKSP